MGAAYAAGLALGLYDERIFETQRRFGYTPAMEEEARAAKYSGWLDAVAMVMKK